MRRYTKRETFAETGPKDHWHPYGLQGLRPEKFIVVVDAIIQGHQRLLPLRRRALRAPDGTLTDHA
jgi:hypothetical protein